MFDRNLIPEFVEGTAEALLIFPCLAHYQDAVWGIKIGMKHPAGDRTIYFQTHRSYFVATMSRASGAGLPMW